MNDFEKCFDAMNFKFNSKPAICVNIHSRDLLIYSDVLIKGCKQHYKFFDYVCKYVICILEKNVKFKGVGTQEIVEEMEKSACNLKYFNDNLDQFIVASKNNFKNGKYYVIVNEIMYLLNKAKFIAFTMLIDTNNMINAAFLKNSRHNSDFLTFLDYVVSDKYLIKYKWFNDELCNLKSMFKNEMNNIVTLSDDAVKTIEAA